MDCYTEKKISFFYAESDNPRMPFSNWIKKYGHRNFSRVQIFSIEIRLSVKSCKKILNL